MEVTVTIEGLKGVEDALSQAGPKLAKRALRKALQEGGQVFLDEVKRRAPVMAQGTPQRKPGELRDALDMTVKLSAKQESGTATIGIKHDKKKGRESPAVWGSFVEFGWIHGAAQPYMRPGYETRKNNAQESFTNEIRDGVASLGK